ncbi:ABC-F family ATP-binding cassette domain-containing protein [Agrilactobacillus fermenti]|uniref:ABC-F family ATP-binding cassette domain-containing protein n=1 Tax=Agrilactobacillus fermenti TaxID=2586909 RepID=UPI001E3A4D5C|nr:ABC-F family ATP-binding cassette domain-containing protein [Agrilactobacillus fermenti]MCD2255205.1 ABC-F family ATP-binding cassette domain-containing protein [Agrilactobacillus fermenti]
MSVLTVKGLSHRFIDKQLYTDASLFLNPNDHMGIIGENGAGKSTLIKILTGQIIPDEGQIKWQRGIDIGYLDQYASLKPGVTVEAFLDSAFQKLIDAEKRMLTYYDTYSSQPDDDLLAKAGKIQEQLESQNYYERQTSIDNVASGLGILALYGRDVSELSGGQRSKLILAKMLLTNPDVLLLDEPTNFLDKEHIDWLADFLANFTGAFIVISHDFDFLNRITNCISDIELSTITRYTGSLKQALRQKAANQATYQKEFEKQQREVSKLKKYIAKNKAGTRAKSAKSREKQLDKMSILKPLSNNRQANIEFPYTDTASQILYEVNNLSIGYDQNKALLHKPLNFSVGNGEKIVITGFNGAGKSTLIKTMMGKIPALAGTVTTASTVVTNYYWQELIWPNKNMSPLQYLQGRFEDAKPKVLRQVLARAGLSSQQAQQGFVSLSGGEQSKVKLAEMMLHSANVLILDEPTNHLDVQTKDNLKQALQVFPGAVLLVSHEAEFYAGSWIDTVLDIEKSI